MKQWTTDDVPDLTGRVAIVTGANRGIGLPLATDLARHNARVVVATRDPEKAAATAALIRDRVPDGDVESAPLDLADLSSVRAFADRIVDRFDRLDLLINNAGVGYVPRSVTVDGFETTFGTNHLGHFALSGLLLPLLLGSGDARLVTVASSVHALPTARLDLDDLSFERGYRRDAAYARSKLANVLFARELHSRLTGAGHALRSVSVNPGLTVTDFGPSERVRRLMLRIRLGRGAQPAARGAIPILYAALAPEVRGGDYVRPVVRGGPPIVAEVALQARDDAVSRRLWELSEAATGVTFPIAPAVVTP